MALWVWHHLHPQSLSKQAFVGLFSLEIKCKSLPLWPMKDAGIWKIDKDTDILCDEFNVFPDKLKYCQVTTVTLEFSVDVSSLSIPIRNSSSVIMCCASKNIFHVYLYRSKTLKWLGVRILLTTTRLWISKRCISRALVNRIIIKVILKKEFTCIANDIYFD